MSEPAMFALVRNGEARFFANRWAGALLQREVMWGPDDFEKWVLQIETARYSNMRNARNHDFLEGNTRIATRECQSTPTRNFIFRGRMSSIT